MSKETVVTIREATDNTLQLLDPQGEVLFECELGDEYHTLILEVGLNKILKDAIKHWELEDKPEVSEYYDDFPKLPDLKKDINKHKMMKALEDVYKYFSDDDAEISDETFELLEELFGELPYNWKKKK